MKPAIDQDRPGHRHPLLLPVYVAALFSFAACDSSPSNDTKAEPPAKVEAKAVADSKPAAEPTGAIAVAEYPKAIVGKWKKVKSTLTVPGSSEPFDATAPGIEQFLEFTADGKFVNSGIVEGKEHATHTTYALQGAGFRVGSNDPIAIESLSTDVLITKTTTEAGTAVDEYRRAK